MKNSKWTGDYKTRCGGSGSPSLPSDGGEGRGEEARFSLGFPSPQSSPHSCLAGRGGSRAAFSNRFWIVLIALVTGLGVSTVLLRTRSPRPLDMNANQATDANERNPAVEQNEAMVYQPTPLATVPVRKLAPAIPPTPDKTAVPAADITSEPANMVRVRADQVLAKVNDRAILLADLVPLRPDEQEQAMTAEEYESRLNRAIEMELTLQAAAAGGVDLTPEQKRRVEGVAQKHEAALQEYRKQGVTWSSVTATQVEFEQRLTSALMLQQKLVAREADVTPSPDATLQARYEDALRALFVRLKSTADITTL